MLRTILLSGGVGPLVAFPCMAQYAAPLYVSQEDLYDATALIAFDADGDGDQDLVGGSENGGVVLFENADGQGGWVPQVLVPHAAYLFTLGLQVVDVDGDGLTDVVVEDGSAQERWVQNLGGGAFAPMADLALLPPGEAMPRFADVNSDGLLDLFTFANDDKIRYRLNLGGGLFDPPIVVVNTFSNIRAASIFDMDQDGDQDLMVMLSSGGGLVQLFQNTGGAMFVAGTSFSTIECGLTSFIPAAFIEDVDMDGVDDIVERYCIPGQQGFRWRRGLGAGTYQALADLVIVTGLLKDAQFADLNMDGYPDVIACTETRVEVAISTGPATFQPPTVIYQAVTGSQMGPMVVTESDTTNVEQDILVGEGSYQRLLHFVAPGNGTVAYIGRSMEGLRDYDMRLRMADLDGDGLAEVIRNARNEGLLMTYHNLGPAGFMPYRVLLESDPLTDFEIEDMDGDGDLDLLAFSDELKLLTNQGGLLFQQTYSFALPSSFGESFHCRDLDGDGDIDIAGPYGNAIRLLRNDGNNTFTLMPSQTALGFFSGPEVMGSMDVDGDGDLDLLASENFGPVNWIRNDGGLSFGARFGIAGSAGANDLQCVDIDMDGDLDLYGNRPGDPVLAWWCANLGNAQFAPLVQILAGSTDIEYPLLADVDADGDPDLVLPMPGPAGGFIRVNDGTGVFTNQIPLGTGDLSMRNESRFAFGDVDSDSDMDLLYFTSSAVWNPLHGIGLSLNTTNIITLAVLPTHSVTSTAKAAPNPFSDYTLITPPIGFRDGEVTMLLVDAQGRTVLQERLRVSGSFVLERAGLSAGPYQLQVMSDSGARYALRLLVL